jgi:hypothetical protein
MIGIYAKMHIAPFAVFCLRLSQPDLNAIVDQSSHKMLQ